jgi:hypothetical protein
VRARGVQEGPMSTVIVIPARYASTRYPGKPLVVLKGPDGAKTLIQRSWEAARAVRGADRVVVATDDDADRGGGAGVRRRGRDDAVLLPERDGALRGGAGRRWGMWSWW